MNEEDRIELQVVSAGGPHARYTYRASDGELELTAVSYPNLYCPADLCLLLQSLTPAGGFLRALLVGTVSHPPGCFVPARLLGMIEMMEDGRLDHLLVAVAAADSHFENLTEITTFPPHRQSAIELFLRTQTSGQDISPRWCGLAETRQLVREARQAFRLAQAHKRTPQEHGLAWKPLFNIRERETARETERHSAAEYAYTRLPARFRQYIASDLARDERILSGVHRPAMRSGQRHGWHRGRPLQEAVFFISDRQVAELAELMPPDRAGIRYGFVARGSVPERLEEVEVVDLSPGVVGLAATWRAADGCERQVWEFPADQRSKVEEATVLLRGWIAREGDTRLRRATLPEPPESFSDLSDPGANDPADTRSLVARRAREILDSRGNPTIEVDVYLEEGAMGRAAVPSGASTGVNEALELRDGDAERYGGKGVRRAVANVLQEIAPALQGVDVADQEALDQALIDLDGTANKTRLGANAILGVSMAAARAAAEAKGVPLYEHLNRGADYLLPAPMMNVLNGGAHTNWTTVTMQEFMVMPVGAPTFAEALRWGAETYHALKGLLKDQGFVTTVGDEGGFAPRLERHEEVLELLVRAIERAGYRPGEDIALALDPAASGFYRDGLYHLAEFGAQPAADIMAGSLPSLAAILPHCLPGGWSGRGRLGRLAEPRPSSWQTEVQLVGDDIFVTNVEFIRRGIEAGRQLGADQAEPDRHGDGDDRAGGPGAAGWTAVVSHRSGETADPFIADFVVAMGTGQIKTGAPARSERVEKYNQLLRIEEELGEKAVYAGRNAFQR
jgi:enolase